MMTPLFIGSGVALVTPFDKDGKINFKLFKKLIEIQIANHTDAVVVCGTTGEGSTLSVEERLELFSVANETIQKRVPLICGTGSNSTSFTLDVAKKAEECGADAHLMVTPYYNKTSQEGLVRHYFALADKLNKPIIVYNVPSRTGMNIKPETYKKLAQHENIVAVKEADTCITKLIKSVVLCEDKLDFYCGNDDLVSVCTSFGFKGVVSVLANIMPQYTHKMALCGVNGECEKCAQMQKDCMELVENLFIDVNPMPIKAALKIAGIDAGKCRLPLCELSLDCRELLMQSMQKHLSEIRSELRI